MPSPSQSNTWSRAESNFLALYGKQLVTFRPPSIWLHFLPRKGLRLRKNTPAAVAAGVLKFARACWNQDWEAGKVLEGICGAVIGATLLGAIGLGITLLGA